MTNWKVIDAAARDGAKRRVMCDDGVARKWAIFKPPHWWEFGDGAMRLADAEFYSGNDLIKVTQYEA
jgi:hypothetical protein